MFVYSNKKIKSLREKAGLSKEALAHSSNLSFATVANLEREVVENDCPTYPNAFTLANLMSALDAKPADFFEEK